MRTVMAHRSTNSSAASVNRKVQERDISNDNKPAASPQEEQKVIAHLAELHSQALAARDKGAQSLKKNAFEKARSHFAEAASLYKDMSDLQNDSTSQNIKSFNMQVGGIPSLEQCHTFSHANEVTLANLKRSIILSTPIGENKTAIFKNLILILKRFFSKLSYEVSANVRDIATKVLKNTQNHNISSQPNPEEHTTDDNLGGGRATSNFRRTENAEENKPVTVTRMCGEQVSAEERTTFSKNVATFIRNHADHFNDHSSSNDLLRLSATVFRINGFNENTTPQEIVQTLRNAGFGNDHIPIILAEQKAISRITENNLSSSSKWRQNDSGEIDQLPANFFDTLEQSGIYLPNIDEILKSSKTAKQSFETSVPLKTAQAKYESTATLIVMAQQNLRVSFTENFTDATRIRTSEEVGKNTVAQRVTTDLGQRDNSVYIEGITAQQVIDVTNGLTVNGEKATTAVAAAKVLLCNQEVYALCINPIFTVFSENNLIWGSVNSHDPNQKMQYHVNNLTSNGNKVTVQFTAKNEIGTEIQAELTFNARELTNLASADFAGDIAPCIDGVKITSIKNLDVAPITERTPGKQFRIPEFVTTPLEISKALSNANSEHSLSPEISTSIKTALDHLTFEEVVGSVGENYTVAQQFAKDIARSNGVSINGMQARNTEKFPGAIHTPNSGSTDIKQCTVFDPTTKTFKTPRTPSEIAQLVVIDQRFAIIAKTIVEGAIARGTPSDNKSSAPEFMLSKKELIYNFYNFQEKNGKVSIDFSLTDKEKGGTFQMTFYLDAESLKNIRDSNYETLPMSCIHKMTVTALAGLPVKNTLDESISFLPELVTGDPIVITTPKTQQVLFAEKSSANLNSAIQTAIQAFYDNNDTVASRIEFDKNRSPNVFIEDKPAADCAEIGESPSPVDIARYVLLDQRPRNSAIACINGAIDPYILDTKGISIKFDNFKTENGKVLVDLAINQKNGGVIKLTFHLDAQSLQELHKQKYQMAPNYLSGITLTSAKGLSILNTDTPDNMILPELVAGSPIFINQEAMH